MNSNKNIKSLIRKYLLEQETTYGPPNWFRVPPNTVQDTTKYEYSPDGKWYKQKNPPAPNTGDGALVEVTAAVFKGIESILGKTASTIRDGVMYVPDKIIEQYKEALAETKYRYKDKNGDVYDNISYEDMGKKIGIGDVTRETIVK